MKDWDQLRLQDITEPVKDICNPTELENIPYIGLEHIEQETLRLTGFGSSLDVTSAKFKFRPNDILFGKLRPYFRKIVKPTFTGVCSTDIWVFRAKKNVDQNYLFYFLANWDFIHTADGGECGTRMPRADWDYLKDTKWFIPSLEKQHEIALILTSLDDKIHLLHQQNKTLEQLAETLFRQWFVEEADESWEKLPLYKILTITSSKRIYYSEYLPSGIPFYRSKEIIELHNTGTTSSELFISQERFKEIKHRFGAPIEGDILMTSVGTLGVPYRVRKNDKFYFKDGNLTWFKDFKIIPSSIIYLWLNSKYGQEQLSNITIGSTQEALTIEGLKGILFKIPAKDKINACQKEFDIIIDKIENNHINIQGLTRMRDTLIPKLLTGEIRIQK